jgi:hypothetical protein
MPGSMMVHTSNHRATHKPAIAQVSSNPAVRLFPLTAPPFIPGIPHLRDQPFIPA